MFRRLPDEANHLVTIEFEGTPIEAREGDTVAAALLASGVVTCGANPVNGQPRAPHCMMGVCFECLMEIERVPNRQACQVIVRDGMQVARQVGARQVES